MKKVFFTLFAAGSLVFANSATDAQNAVEAQPQTQVAQQQASEPAIVQVSNGTYKFKYATNVRADAGTSHRVVKVASKGATATVTKTATIGSGKWFKVRTGSTHGWVHSSLVTKSSGVVQASSSSVSSSAVVSQALALKGIPYRFGGTTPAGFDCSGFVQYAFKKAGKSVSRTTLSQYAQSYKVSSPRPGDLVFFANTYRAGISHVGIYIGNNQFVHSGGSKAEVKSLNGPYWGAKFHSFRRF